MATAFAVTELFKSDSPRIQESVFKGVALLTLLIGTGLAVSGIRPTDVIFIAQIANGLLLPIVAASLLYAMNRKTLLGDRVNGLLSNVLGVGVVLITLLMGIRGIGRAVGFWP